MDKLLDTHRRLKRTNPSPEIRSNPSTIPSSVIVTRLRRLHPSPAFPACALLAIGNRLHKSMKLGAAVVRHFQVFLTVEG